MSRGLDPDDCFCLSKGVKCSELNIADHDTVTFHLISLGGERTIRVHLLKNGSSENLDVSATFPLDDSVEFLNNNNNTFTWCGPSGVLGCTGQRPVGPAAGGCKSRRRLSRCAIQPAESGMVRKPPQREKITTQVYGRVTTNHTQPRLTLNRPYLGSIQLSSRLISLRGTNCMCAVNCLMA
jgi:hypothetical protein